MLDSDTKRRIDSCRDILVGKVPDPKSQVEQITIALIYKFMDDMDTQSEELGGKRAFFAGDFAQYGWAKLLSPAVGGFEMLGLYSEAIARMGENPGVPTLFRDIFKNAYLPYRDPETLRAFLKEINVFTYDHSEKLGDAFEYLLSVLGSQGDAGQFRTPRHIIDFIVQVVNPQKNETILDPACGTAGFLISSYKHILAANMRDRPGDLLSADERTRLAANLVGYDISPDMVRLSLANLYLHGFVEPQVEEYDTLTSDDKWNHYADVILANPPFMSPKGGIKPHNRFSVPSSRSEVLFVDYIAEHLTPTGRAGIIVPEGIIFQSGTSYKTLRKMLVENYLVAVVSLPAGVFQPYSGVKTSVLILDKRLAKTSDSVLFVKIASDGFGLGAQRRAVALNDLPEAARLLTAWSESLRDGTEFDLAEAANVQVVAKSKIAASSDYNLSGDRYIDGKVAGDNAFPFVALGDVCERVVDTIMPSEYSGSVDYIGLENIEADKGVLAGDINAQYGNIKSAKSRFEPGQILYGKLRPNLNKVYYSTISGVCSTDIYVFKAKENISGKFLAEMLRSSPFNTEVLKGLGGAQLPRVSFDYLSGLILPLPPLAVQQEIVAEIEGYQKVIDGARQVVENYTPRIDVRPEWPMVELREVCELITKGTTPTSIGCTFQDEGIRFIKIENIDDNGMISNKRNVFISQDCHEQLQRSQLRLNDILFSIAGSLGHTAIVDRQDLLPANTNQALAIIRAKESLTPRYLFYYLRSQTVQNGLDNLKVGVAQLNLSLKQVSEFIIPLPDFETQWAIVAEIEAEQQLVEASRQLVTRFEAKIKAAIGRVWGEGE